MDIDQLNRITEKIKSKQNASEDFREYILNIPPEGKSYTKDGWPVNWRNSVYEFGKTFKTADAGEYLEVIKMISHDNDTEVLDFFYSEILWNYFEQDNDYVKDCLRGLIEKYPTNPEFHHTYSQFLEKNKSYDRAIFEVAIANKIEPDNKIFIRTYVSKFKTYFDINLSKGKLEKAAVVLSDAKKFIGNLNNAGVTGWEMYNQVSLMEDRLRDHTAFEKKVAFFEKGIETKMRIEQKKIIEILGVFSAIIAFILTNITIVVSSLNVSQALYFMIGMAIVLLIFVISISFLFGPKYRYAKAGWFLGSPKFLSLVVLFSLLIYLFLISDNLF